MRPSQQKEVIGLGIGGVKLLLVFQGALDFSWYLSVSAAQIYTAYQCIV